MSWKAHPSLFNARTPLLCADLPPGFEGSLLLFEHELFVGSNRPGVGGGRRRGGVFLTCVDGVFFRHLVDRPTIGGCFGVS